MTAKRVSIMIDDDLDKKTSSHSGNENTKRELISKLFQSDKRLTQKGTLIFFASVLKIQVNLFLKSF